MQSALKEADTRVQKSLKANDGEITPEDRYRIEIFRSQSPSGRRRRASSAWQGVGLARRWRWSRPAPAPRRPASGHGPDPAPDLLAALADAQAMRPDLKLPRTGGILAKEADVHASRAELFLSSGWSVSSPTPCRGTDTITNPYVGDYFNALTIGARWQSGRTSFWTIITRPTRRTPSWNA